MNGKMEINTPTIVCYALAVPINESDVQKLVEKTASILPKVSERIWGAKLKLKSVNDYTKEYEKDLENLKQ